jgi:hypothetical protein
VKATHAARLYVTSVAWRFAKLRPAGKALLIAFSSPDEETATLAGILLSRAGSQAQPLLREALRARQNLPMVLTLLADTGDPRVEDDLSRFAADSDPEVATAARDGLRILASRMRRTHTDATGLSG